ncbi:hypothetical protein CR513_03407, partial [Mucuna pruriens]
MLEAEVTPINAITSSNSSSSSLSSSSSSSAPSVESVREVAKGVVAELSKVVVLASPGSKEDFVLKPCSTSERVYMGSKEGKVDFFCIYEIQLQDLIVSLPFNKFEVDVLGTLSVAPSQLHPNE